MIPPNIQEIASLIGQFFLRENKHDYEATAKFITELRINRLELVDGKLLIETSRPGLLIGRYGETIEKLEAFLGMKIHIEETMQHLLDFLIPYPPYDDDYDHDYDDWLDD